MVSCKVYNQYIKEKQLHKWRELLKYLPDIKIQVNVHTLS